MSQPVFFDAEDAQPLLPLGTCSLCGITEDPMVAIFWQTDEFGGVCPTCSGEKPTEGYPHYVCYLRADRVGEMSRMIGPYSTVEAERVRSYFAAFANVKDAWIITPPEGR